MEYKKYKLDNFNVYTIKTDRFKKCRIEIIFNEDMNVENIIKRDFLNGILLYTNKTYKTKLDLNIRLEELYDSYLFSGTTKLGKTLVSNFGIEFLNPKYCDKNFLNELLDFFFDVLKNPNVNSKEFDKDSFNTMKNVMESRILGRKENPKNVAFDKLLSIMSNDPIINYAMPGTLKDLKKVTPRNLYEYYQKSYQKINCNILIIGDLEMDEVVKAIEKRYPFQGDKSYQIKNHLPMEETLKEQFHREKANYNQSVLAVGYNWSNLSFKDKQIIVPVISGLLDGDSLNGKLPKYLREDNSLCYYVYSVAKAENDVLYIMAGIDAKNYDKALKLIKKSINDIKKGNITKDELNNAKQGLKNFLDTINDRQQNLIDDYYMTEMGLWAPLKERRKGIEKVTIKDIMKVAKNIKINTAFLLEGEFKNEKN